MLAIAFALLAPALAHGPFLGPFDELSARGLTRQSGVTIHNLSVGDQINEMIPWTTLAWTQVHQGHLPLWNPYSGLGMPLAFNWQSAPFGVPALFGYLVPVRYAYTVGMLTTLFVAGTGAYVLSRVLQLSVLASIFTGTVFELSGPVTGWLGFPHSAVASWGGWIFAATLLVVRGAHRARSVAFLAVVLALAVYAGQPEVLTVLGIAIVVFLIVLLGPRVRGLRGSGPLLRPLFDLILASVAGLALAAPLALPGLQLVNQSVRSTAHGHIPLPVHNLTYFIFQGFDGLPIVSNHPFGLSYLYDESAAYVGLIAVVLALVAVGTRYRRAEVLAFAAVAVAMLLLLFVSPLESFMNSLPFIGRVDWWRTLFMLALAMAVLAGVGLDSVQGSWQRESIRRWAGAGFVGAAIMLLGLWIFGRGHLPRFEETIRARSFIWPTVETALGLAVVGALSLVCRIKRSRVLRVSRLAIGRSAGLALLAGETAFLIAAGAPMFSSSSQFFAPTPAVTTLERAVRNSTVAIGPGTTFEEGAFCEIGIAPEANIAFHVRQLDAYDPILPSAYYTGWNGNAGDSMYNLFCPKITTAALGRLYGVAFVLVPAGARGPAGSVFDRRVGDEDLYRIAGAAAATLSPVGPSGSIPPAEAEGTTVPVTHPSPSSLKLETASATPQVLRLRLAAVPGWSATVDGRPLHLVTFEHIMLEARIPPGRHTVELHYWPSAFTKGIVLACCSLTALAGVVVFSEIRRRRMTRSGPSVRLPHGLPR